MFLITKIIDGITDLIVGFLIDKTNTKMGKSRPWILGWAIPFGISLVLCFSVPDLSSNGKLIYAYLTYSLLSLTYTVVNVPFCSFIPYLTKYSKDDIFWVNNIVTFFMFGGYIIGASSLTFYFIDATLKIQPKSATLTIYYDYKI